MLELRLRMSREQSHEDRGGQSRSAGSYGVFRNVAMSNGGCAGGILACNVPRRERLDASGPQMKPSGPSLSSS